MERTQDSLTPGEWLVEARKIAVERAGRLVVRDVDVTLKHGERLGIAGPNGSGKSTLLKVLALLLRPSRGSVRVLGVSGGGRVPVHIRRQMAVVFQEPYPLVGSVLDNVALPLRLRGISRPEAKRRAGVWLERFSLRHLAEQPARTLSGGEQARMQLARAFAAEPRVLFLDEPFAAVDATSRAPLKALLDDIFAEQKITVILISHDFQDLLHLTHRTMVLLDGRVAAVGETAFLRERSPVVQALFP